MKSEIQNKILAIRHYIPTRELTLLLNEINTIEAHTNEQDKIIELMVERLVLSCDNCPLLHEECAPFGCKQQLIDYYTEMVGGK